MNRWTNVRRAARVDLEALKQAHPIQEVLAAYGVALRQQGRAAVGRCPFHADQGRPNLHVWGDSASWFCFRCCVGGDVVRFLELAEGISFREAVQRLAAGGATGARPVVGAAAPHTAATVKRGAAECTERDSDELVTLRAATTLYHRRLLTDPPALAYLEQRGVDRATIEACQLGYAAGDELVPLLRWRRIDLGPALRVGLLDQRGQEFLAGRIVVPELRAGQPVWLVGRLLPGLDASSAEQMQPPPPKYLALRGGKPLLGIEQAQGLPSVIVVEGAFDFLAVRRWGYPAVALLGTHVRPEVVDQLRAFQRVFLVLDQDDAGLEATLRLADVLGSAVPVALPEGIKDVGELAPRADGQSVFASALLEATGSLEPDLGAGTAL